MGSVSGKGVKPEKLAIKETEQVTSEGWAK